MIALRQGGDGGVAGRHGADQRHGDMAAGIDGVGIGEAFLAEHDDAQAVARIKGVGRFLGGVGSGRRGDHRRLGDRRRFGDGKVGRRLARAAGQGGPPCQGEGGEKEAAMPHETQSGEPTTPRLTPLMVNKV